MKTKTINLYTYDELTKEAQEVALREWRDNNDYFFLSDNLAERLHELLEENKIKDTNDTSKAGTKPTPVLYSLSRCQGDGAMFEGVFEWNGYTVSIKHSGHYYHSNSKTIEITNDTGDYIEDKPFEDFEALYQKICKELERYGYDFIEYEDSEENFKEACDANEYTFLLSGKMENE
jgi:hypothetical protein